MNLIIQIFTYQYNVRVLHKYIQFRKVLLVTKTFLENLLTVRNLVLIYLQASRR